MDELARLKRELEFARAYVAKLPEAEKVILQRTRAAEIRLGYLRDPESEPSTSEREELEPLP